MLLNSDTLLVDDSPFRGVELFEHNRNVAVLGVVNYLSDNPSKIWQAGMNLRKTYLGFKPVAPVADSEITLCDYVAGSSLILRLSLLDDIGFLNEDYFAYYEEIDYCFRIQKFGMKVGYINNSKILHKVGASSSSGLRTYLKSRNKLYFYQTICESSIHFIVVTTLLLMKDLALILIKDPSTINFRNLFLGIIDFRNKKMELSRFQGED